MSTSYANPLGSGDRRTLIRVTSAGGLINDAGDAGFKGQSVNGNTTENLWFFNNVSLTSSVWIKFDFGGPILIDEAKFYQELTTAQGTWKWQGSLDDSSWTDIGSSFALGGIATQTLTELNGNVTRYRWYRLLGVSGSTSNSPWIREFEFKVETDPNDLTFGNAQGSGNRTSSITVTESGGTVDGTISHLVDGTIFTNDWGFFNALTVDGSRWIKFDFATAIVIDEIWFYLNSSGSTQGTWKFQGSNDNSSWTDIGSSFVLGGLFYIQRISEVNGNTTAYRYYRLLGVSGTTSSSAFLHEFEFRAGSLSGPTTLTETVSDTISLSDSISSLLVGVIEESASDTLSFSDNVLFELFGVNEVVESDSIVLGDSIALSINHALQFSDTLSLSDSIAILGALVSVLSDALTLSDSLVFDGEISFEFSDRIILADLMLIAAPATAVPGDTISLSDSARIVLSIEIIVSDSISLDDSVSVQRTAVLSIVVSDALSLSDSVQFFGSTSTTNYLRPYLNDVQGIRTPESISDPADEDPGELNDYLRKYLNDIT